MTKAVSPPSVEDWVPVVGERGYDYIRSLWEDVYGTDGVTVNIELLGSYFSNLWANRYHEDPPDFLNTSAAYTTARDCVLIVTDAVTITLNPYPHDGETATIKRATSAGPVTVLGTIDGDSSYVMLVNYESKTFIYLQSAGEWLIT